MAITAVCAVKHLCQQLVAEFTITVGKHLDTARIFFSRFLSFFSLLLICFSYLYSWA